MEKKLQIQLFGVWLLVVISTASAVAQFTVTGQFRTRSELRDGQGTLTTQAAEPAFFTSQRTRLSVSYEGYRFRVFTTLQDVRVWGQEASTINRLAPATNDGLLVHEAWGEIMLLDTVAAIQNLSLKIGRQELVYDDGRLLGNLDWLQQGRRHDLALLKMEHQGWTGHLGVAYNQNQERKTGTIYNGSPVGYAAGTNNIGTLYKSMQFLYAGRKFKKGSASFLALKDDFNQYHLDSTVRVLDKGQWSRVTAGFYATLNLTPQLNFTGSAYHQGGKDKDGAKLRAHLFSAAAMYVISRQVSVGPGIDYTSGNNRIAPNATNRQFDPLYGTPHKFWGYMDYFYVADGFGKNGLVNYYLKSRYKIKENFWLSLDAHQFITANPVFTSDRVRLDPNLGTELDFLVNYNLTKVINLEAGYAHFFATPTMAAAAVKNVTNPDLQANWAYLMVNLKPSFLNK